MKKLLLILLSALTLVQGQSIDECKVDLYYATDIILPEEERNSEELWRRQSIELLKKYPQLNSRIGERKVAYHLSEGLISDYLVKAKENPVAGVAWTVFRIGILAYVKSKPTKFIAAQVDAAMLMIHNNTLKKQIDSYNKSIESGHGIVVVAHSTGNLFTEEVFREFDEKGEGWKQKYFHTIAVASTQGSIINGGHGVTFDNDIVYLEEVLQANEDVKISNPNRHDWGYKNAVNEHILNPDFWSSEYHKFEYYLGYPVMETTRITEEFNTVESKPRQTNIAKDLIIQWLYDEIVAHSDRESQWEKDTDFNKNTKDYRISVKHKYNPTDIKLDAKLLPFNIDKKVYQVEGKYVKASCGGKHIKDTWDGQKANEFWLIDNDEEEKIKGEEFFISINIIGEGRAVAAWEYYGNNYYNGTSASAELYTGGYSRNTIFSKSLDQTSIRIENESSLWECNYKPNPCITSNEIKLNQYMHKDFDIVNNILTDKFNAFLSNDNNAFDLFLDHLGLYDVTYDSIKIENIVLSDTRICTDYSVDDGLNSNGGGSDGFEICRRKMKYRLDIYK